MATSIVTGLRPDSAAGKVLARLRHGAMTVEDLAKALRLTANAVRNQLRTLQAANLVATAGKRPGTSKPSMLYAITLEGQIQFSTLYLPVLTHFLAAAEGGCSGKQLDALMLQTGKSLAHRYPKPVGGLRHRVHAAAQLLSSFGGVSEVGTRDGALLVRSRACPLAALTSEKSAACKVLQGFLQGRVEAKVTICCSLNEKPQCCFEVRP